MNDKVNNPLKLKCTECSSTNLRRFGRIWSKDNRTGHRRKFQRWQCDNCGVSCIRPKGWEKQYD